MGGSPNSRRSTFSPQLDPPLPILATEDFGSVTVTFCHNLVPGVIDPTNWSGRFAARLFTAGSAVVTFAGVALINLVLGAADPGPDVVTFAPPPFDLLSDTARQIPAPAFTDFPIT